MNYENHPRKNERDWRFTTKGKIALGATALLVSACAAMGIYKAVESNGPHFSDETLSKMVAPGDTLWEIAKDVDGRNGVDIRDIVDYIEAIPSNADVFEDKKLGQGEVLDVPSSVTP